MTIDDLIAVSESRQLKIAVTGDALDDIWIHGRLDSCQDHCPRFVQESIVRTPGGAANAARQLAHLNCLARLVCPTSGGPRTPPGAWQEVDTSLCMTAPASVMKCRFMVDGRVVWRQDCEPPAYGLSEEQLAECRRLVLSYLESLGPWDGVLISDYDKGWLDAETIQAMIRFCNKNGVPVVADVKRRPPVYEGAILKCNQEYASKFWTDEFSSCTAAVITNGCCWPSVWKSKENLFTGAPGAVICRSHVGAGDCFSAWLIYALAADASLRRKSSAISCTLEEAAIIAHSAGRIYVQHLHGRPPWPHEIKKDIDPVGGKVCRLCDLPALRRSIPGRIVFTNGRFAIPHAGHAHTLSWARQQGDVLVVGVNSDLSAYRQRPERFCLKVEERLRILASMSCVDWLVTFDEDDPREVIRALRPDVLVKGSDYAGQRVPGDETVKDVRFAPPSIFRHASDIEREIRG